MNDRILRMYEVERLIGLHRTTIYRMIKKDAFPKQARIGFRAVGWRESQLSRWLEARGLS
ncbi:helix-turn-helix transcriptional regulator [Histidinibacterium aquaticum]|uniref:AlpA family phage regulatory protein n=1 Tax=Histidinibacterium aquaticum TaxID=2613962 RepID=A0A5J5GHS5_9RHOB|nr:AlpA family phage regulatory protein [Histidinibacterium aquaticum]KAA9007786.1 AlpA family phage regulatory protein [Histidinibacterium aquaticum]